MQALTCDQCSAVLFPAAFRSHQERFHAWHRCLQWACRHCPYRRDSLSQALAHAYLEGHELQRDCVGYPDWGDAETSVEATALITPQNVMETGREDMGSQYWAPPSEYSTKNSESTKVDKPHVRCSISAEPVTRNRCQYPAGDLPQPVDISCPSGNFKPIKHKEAGSSVRKRSSDTPVVTEEPRFEDQDDNRQSKRIRKMKSRSKTSVKVRLECQNCRGILRASKAYNKSRIALAHVRACYGIRPYACSSCDYLSSEKNSAQYHIGAHCEGAEMVTVDRERNEAAIRKGLKRSFPTLHCNWRVLL